MILVKNCLICGKEFKTYSCKTKIGWGKFCGRPCYFQYKKTLRGKKNGNWRGGKLLRDEYVLISNPEWINETSKRRYVLEHRYLMEKHINRGLSQHEEVHHINGNKQDNRLKNLKIVTKANHEGKVICPHCHKEIWSK